MYRFLIVIYFVQKQSSYWNISNSVNELGTEGFRRGFFGSPLLLYKRGNGCTGEQDYSFIKALLVYTCYTSSLLQWCKLQTDVQVLFDISNFEHSTTTKTTTVHVYTWTHTITTTHENYHYVVFINNRYLRSIVVLQVSQLLGFCPIYKYTAM